VLFSPKKFWVSTPNDFVTSVKQFGGIWQATKHDKGKIELNQLKRLIGENLDLIPQILLRSVITVTGLNDYKFYWI
jgi:hypothetical protein